MKRYTKRIKNFDKLATLVDFIYISSSNHRYITLL